MFADRGFEEVSMAGAARSAVILGDVHVGVGAILAQGLVVRVHADAV